MIGKQTASAAPRKVVHEDLSTEPAEPSSASSPFVNTHGVIAMAAPLGRDLVLKLMSTDPRFPAPVFGGGAGSRRVYSRRKVAAYLDELAENGAPE